MLAGPKREADLVTPILSGMGKVFYIGAEPGMGQVMKLINNLLSATAQAATAEAMIMGTKFGLDPTLMIEVLNAGTGRNSATDRNCQRNPAPPLQGRLRHGPDGEGFAARARDRRGVACADVGAQAVKQLWLYAEGRGGPDQDITELVKHLEAWSGVTVAGKKP